MMATVPNLTVFDVITDFLASHPSNEAILAYRLPEALEQRALDLVERNGEGLLTFDEEMEMFDFMRADDLMAMLKAKTRLEIEGKS